MKGQVVIIDDTVDHDALGRREPLRTTGPTAMPREVREGQAPHGRDSGPQAGRSWFPLRREEDVGFGDGHRVQDLDRRGQMFDVLKEPFR